MLIHENYLHKAEDKISDLEQENEYLSNELQELTMLNKVFFDKLIELGVDPNDYIED